MVYGKLLRFLAGRSHSTLLVVLLNILENVLHKIVIVEKIIRICNGDRSTKIVSHKTFKVYLNGIELASFDGYDRLWSAYADCSKEAQDFANNLCKAVGIGKVTIVSDEEFNKAARSAALAKLTSEERKLLNL